MVFLHMGVWDRRRGKGPDLLAGGRQPASVVRAVEDLELCGWMRLSQAERHPIGHSPFSGPVPAGVNLGVGDGPAGYPHLEGVAPLRNAQRVRPRPPRGCFLDCDANRPLIRVVGVNANNMRVAVARPDEAAVGVLVDL